jgi:hypothetical protein
VYLTRFCISNPLIAALPSAEKMLTIMPGPEADGHR